MRTNELITLLRRFPQMATVTTGSGIMRVHELIGALRRFPQNATITSGDINVFSPINGNADGNAGGEWKYYPLTASDSELPWLSQA